MTPVPSYLKQTVVALLGIMAVCFFSCTKNKAPLQPVKPLPAVVSFSTHIIPLFNTYCNTSGCHGGSSPAAHLDLSPAVAYKQLFAHQEVDTVNADASVIYIQMNSTSNPMPLSGRLSDYEVGLVYKWIRQKAKNN